MAFVYGRPVQASEFLDRDAELRAVFNRIRNNESTAIVGEPHVGKSSMLLKLADPATRRSYLGVDDEHMLVILLDLHPIATDYTPNAFWQEIVESAAEVCDVSLKQHLENVIQTNYSRRSLEKMFSSMGGQGCKMVLMLDEFERLLSHPGFKDPAFFALLRSLATRTGGLVVVTASRLPVAEMNELGRGLLDTGSPFFNFMIEVRLHSFDDRAAGILLDRAGNVLTSDDRRFIRRVAGLHPFLLQAMIATMAETIGADRHSRAAERFCEEVAMHFDDVWHNLDDRTRTTAVILSLVEFGGRVLGSSFSYSEIERADAFGPELRKLEERGLAEQIGHGWQFDQEHLLVWRGERWTIGSQAFAWWVRDLVIGGTRGAQKYDEWLRDKRYVMGGIVTQQQWDQLLKLVQKAPDWAVRGVGGLARALFEELVKGASGGTKK